MSKKTFIYSILFMTLMLSQNISGVVPDTITVATIDIEPFGFKHSGENYGLYYDFANKILNRAGFKSTNVIVPFARAHESVILGLTDMTIMFSTDSLEKNAIQSPEIIEFENLLIPAKHFRLNNIKDINGKRVGIIRAGCADLLANKKINPKYTEFNDYEQGVNLLISGRVDAICGSSIPVKYTLTKINSTDPFLKRSLVITKRKAFVHYSKKLDPQIINKINKVIVELSKEHYFQKAMSSYHYLVK